MSDQVFRPQDLGIGRLFARVRDAVIAADAGTGRIVLWNPAATEVFGYSISEALEMNVEELVPEAFKVQHRAGLARYRETGHGPYIDSTQFLELPAVRKTGEEISIEMSLSGIGPAHSRRASEGEGRFALAIIRDITERKRVEEEVARLNEDLEKRVQERTASLETALIQLRNSEERYRSLVESVEDYAIFMLDSDGRIADWNVGAERIFGYREEEIVGQDSGILFTPEDVRRGVPESQLHDAVNEGRAVDERWHTRKDGSRFWASGIVRPVWGRGGDLRGFVRVARDVTEHKRAEDTLRFLAETGALVSSSLNYRTTLARVADLAVPTLGDWCAVDVLEENGSIERLAVKHQDPEKVALALKLQERYRSDPDAPGGVANVLRTGRSEFYPEVTDEMLEAAARSDEHLELLRQLGFVSVIIVPMIAREKTLGAITLVSSESGRRFEETDLGLAKELAHRAGLAVDNARLYEEAQKEIVERQWAEEALRGSRDQLQVILGGVADGVTAQDLSGQLIYANEVAARMVGYPSARALVQASVQEIMRRFEVLDEEGRPFPLERLPGRRALGGEAGAEEIVRFRVIETGEERWSIVKATPIFDESGKVRIAVNILRDVTERRRAEEALRDVRQAERRRLANDLHDGVLQDLTYTAAAMGMVMLEAEGTSLEAELQSAIDAVRRAAQGLRDAVNDLRLEEERDRPFPELVEQLVRRHRAMARSFEISLVTEETFPSVPLRETGTQILRILQEALTNARRHSGARNVIVTLGAEGDELMVEVADDGRGFTSGFPPGIGLRSMRERAAAIGATLEIEGEAGQGTRVRLRVPAPQKG